MLKEATASGQPMQRVRQFVVFDWFPVRVVERFGERVMPKGGVALHTALRTTFEAGTTHEPPRDLPQVPVGWRATYERIVSEFGVPWQSIEALTDAVRAFLAPALESKDSGAWDPVECCWR